MTRYRKELSELSNEIAATGREYQIYLLGKIHGLEMVINPNDLIDVQDHTRYFGDRRLSEMVEILSEFLQIDLSKEEVKREH